MLTHEGIDRFEAFAKKNYSPDLAHIVRHLQTVKRFRKQLDRGGNDQRWRVVTLTRDPVGRNISSFFEILDLQMHYGLQDKLQTKGVEGVVPELCSLFLTEYPDHDLPLTFFHSELKTVFGVDVFSCPFPHSKGYMIYQGENVELLLLRLEDLDRSAPHAFEEFLGIRGVELVRSNIGDQKIYADVYRHFVETIRLPDSYLERMYKSKYATHFYTNEEIETFRAKWHT
jgi:hypothetical protein